MLRRVVVVGCVIAANVLAGYVAVQSGTSVMSVCADTFSAASSSGCFETGQHIDWGPIQGVVFAVPAATAAPKVFNDSGSVQVPLFGS